ncbi:MAG TPA: hypothetical protein VIY48_05025 [Candidatus Paceibacterota bacterium]
MKKLTLVSINGKAVFMKLEVDPDGKVRVPQKELNEVFEIVPGQCVRYR